MTTKLRLVDNDGTEALDLMHGVLRVYNWGWDTQPTGLQQRLTPLPFGLQAASLGYPQAVETLSLMTSGCDAEIRAAVRRLEEFLEEAAAYMHDPIHCNPHWLEWQSDGESPKRALVSGGSRQWYPRPPMATPFLGYGVLLLKLALTRAPLWEATTQSTATTVGTTINSVGGTWQFVNTAGRVPARVAITRFESEDNLQQEITTTWCGFRPENHGLTAFNPLWECETDAGAADGNGTLDVNTADQADASASGGYVARTTFADTDLDRRLWISVRDVIGTPTTPDSVDAQHFAGRYLVLCRCKINDATKSASVQMRSGYLGGEMTVHDLVTINHQDAQYVELGEVQIPPPGIWLAQYGALTYQSHDDQCARFTIELWAQNTDATTLDWDCLVLVPSDYFLHVENGDIYDKTSPVDQRYCLVARQPDERLIAYNAENTAGEVISSASASANQWYLPEGNSLFVLAAQRITEQVITDDLDVIWSWYPRWTSYRD